MSVNLSDLYMKKNIDRVFLCNLAHNKTITENPLMNYLIKTISLVTMCFLSSSLISASHAVKHEDESERSSVASKLKRVGGGSTTVTSGASGGGGGR